MIIMHLIYDGHLDRYLLIIAELERTEENFAMTSSTIIGNLPLFVINTILGTDRLKITENEALPDLINVIIQ